MAKRPAAKPQLPSEADVLEFIQSSPSIVGKREIAKAFGLHAQDKIALKALLKEMMEAGELETGGVFINGYCATDPRVTFGGVKKSGFGRELSHFGVREFCNAQTVWLDRH